MATSKLVLHRGAVTVSEEELRTYKAPQPVGRWVPLDHSRVLDMVRGTLVDCGYNIRALKLGVSREGHRLFGTMDLDTSIAVGVTLAVGFRSSTDRSFPLAMCCGSHVFCCDNMAFRSEIAIKAKHTLHGESRFQAGIANAVAQLGQFKIEEEQNVRGMQELQLKDEQAESLILRAFERGILNTHQLPGVIREWRTPSYPEFEPRNMWSLFNACTTILGSVQRSNPQKFSVVTMRLNSLLSPKDPQLQQAV